MSADLILLTFNQKVLDITEFVDLNLPGADPTK